jgi:hypothetical protein
MLKIIKWLKEILFDDQVKGVIKSDTLTIFGLRYNSHITVIDSESRAVYYDDYYNMETVYLPVPKGRRLTVYVIPQKGKMWNFIVEPEKCMS